MSKEILNKRGLYSYEVVKKYTAGIKLLGEEVKSLRNGGGNLFGSYIKTVDNDLYIVGFNIPKYKKSTSLDYDPKRVRKLLLNQHEIIDIKQNIANKGRTAIPVKVYLKGKLFKVDIAVAKGLTKSGQKQKLKEKQLDRDTARQIKEADY